MCKELRDRGLTPFYLQLNSDISWWSVLLLTETASAITKTLKCHQKHCLK
jgi:hypothetical protein